MRRTDAARKGSPDTVTFVSSAGGLGREDLLAIGVARHLDRAVYETPADRFARILHAPFRAQPIVPSGLPPAGRAGPADPADPLPALLPGERLVLIDVESLGFVGRPVFLIGALFVCPAGVPSAWSAPIAKDSGRETAAGEARLVQYLARDYSEEEAMLRAFLDDCPSSLAWVSFNGRTFDLPALAVRSSFHRLAFAAPSRHLDLLPLARRLWGARLPDCRLQTLEHRICGRPRGGDIQGARIPEAYHAFVRTGEPWEMLEILRHNAADLLSLYWILEEARALAARWNAGGCGPAADPAR